MSRIASFLLVFSAFLCPTWGWEPGTQYIYNYVGRSVIGELQLQSAVIELESRVIVQSIDESTIFVKLTDSHFKRNGSYEHSCFIGENGQPNQIKGEEESIPNSQLLDTPFTVSHVNGSIVGIQIDADEPLWLVNYKKSIVSQLQLDITAVRRDGPAANWPTSHKGNDSDTFTVFEDSIAGDCSNTIAIRRLPVSQVYAHDVFKIGSFDAVCKGQNVYEIVKTADFDRCKNSLIWYSNTPNIKKCDFNKANCGDFMKRMSVYTYVACGETYPRLTVILINGYSSLMIHPFTIKTDPMWNVVSTNWQLERKEPIDSQFSVSPSFREHKSLVYSFGDLFKHQSNHSEAPNLRDAYLKSPLPISTLQKSILDALRVVVRDLKERPDSERDNLERLAVIGRLLPVFSLDELRLFWQDIKIQDSATISLFIDCVVQAGSNPTVMLMKELIESEQITGAKAILAVAAIGQHVKTPTRELLHELVNMVKSGPVQSSKSMKQTALVMVAGLLRTACSSPSAFCGPKDTVIIDEFLPILTTELDSSQAAVDRIPVLTAIGNLGVEEIVPILLSVIRGTPGKFDDTAERVKAIQALYHVASVVPEKIHPILLRLATNIGEQPEVRMAAIFRSLLSNAPLLIWQKIASTTWFDPSQQIVAWTHSLIHSIAKAPPKESSPIMHQLYQKAQSVSRDVKHVPFGLPYSVVYSESSHLDEGISSWMHHVSMRNANQRWPVFMTHRHFYDIDRLFRVPMAVSIWNFNMDDVWKSAMGKINGGTASTKSDNRLGEIWDELNITPRPAEKRAGILHIGDHFIDLEKLAEQIPNFLANAAKYQNAPYDVSVTKYSMLAEYSVHFPTDLGLPMHYQFTLPAIVSMQGNLKGDGQFDGIKSDMATELSWKLSAELRVDIPFSGNYIASGVDVLFSSHLPKQLHFSYNNEPGQIKVTWTLGNKVTDLLYYHVKPYTITRNWSDSTKPTLEDPAVALITNGKPVQQELPLGDRFGVNLRLIEQSELAHTDKWSWWQWFTKHDLNAMSNLDLSVPTKLASRKYILRYEPSGTRARSLTTFFQYQNAVKSSSNNLIYDTGSSSSRSPSVSEMINTSDSPIVAEFRPVLDRLFGDVEMGNAQLVRAGMTAEWKDGTLVYLNATAGYAKDVSFAKDFTEVRIDTYLFGANKKSEFSVCYFANRNWNSPPDHGFSNDVLQMTEDAQISLGDQCDQSKIAIKAKVYRDASAAAAAMSSSDGKQCYKDMESGFTYGSPACTKARHLDQTYNNYELAAETENLPESLSQWASGFSQWMNHILYPFTVKHSRGESNKLNRVGWIIRRDPSSGKSNVTFVRPTETLVVSNVRWEKNILARFSPLTWTFASNIFYPMNAGTNFIRDAAKLATGAVSESKCYVGSDAVYTFDGAHSKYNYTMNQCPHVLLTDCSKESELAVLARESDHGHKIVTVIYGQDTVEMDPSGYVSVNDDKTSFNEMTKGSRIEIRDSQDIKAVIYPIGDGVAMKIRSWNFLVKVQGSNIELSAPMHLRGRICGLCGDFDQEMVGEWKTPGRCAVSSGELMASSFMLKSSGCSMESSNDIIFDRLKKETETCQSIDERYHTPLPEYDVNDSITK